MSSTQTVPPSVAVVAVGGATKPAGEVPSPAAALAEAGFACPAASPFPAAPVVGDGEASDAVRHLSPAMRPTADASSSSSTMCWSAGEEALTSGAVGEPGTEADGRHGPSRSSASLSSGSTPTIGGGVLPASSGSGPVHGTVHRYVKGPDENGRQGAGCRCAACRTANTDRAAVYRTQMAQAAWGAAAPVTVDASVVRAHLQALADVGLTSRSISEISGVSQKALWQILRGTRRTTTAVADRILAVHPTAGLLAEHALVDATGSRRRLQALAAVGWSNTQLADRLGRGYGSFRCLLTRSTIEAPAARQIAKLYDQLWNQPPPETTHAEKIAAARARNRARQQGWLLPAAWDDDLIDLPDAELKTEISRQVAAMDEDELRHQLYVYDTLGERNPLTTTAARTYKRRLTAERRARAKASVKAGAR